MINFQLKSKELNKPQPIIAYITGVFDGANERLKMGLGCSILPNDFGNESDNYKYSRDKISNSTEPSILVVKQIIDKFDIAVNQTDLYFKVFDKKPSRDEFKERLLVQLGRTPKEDKIPKIRFIDFINDYIIEVKELRLKNKKKISDGTILNYVSVIHHITNYELFKGIKLNIDDISYTRYNDFIEVTNLIAINKAKGKQNIPDIKSRVHHKVGKSINTISVITTRLRFLLNQASKRGHQLHKTLNLNDERLVINMQPSSKDYYFTDELLNQIYQFKPKKKSAIKGKDYIMLASTTGMRFESVQKLRGQKPQLITTSNGEEFFAVRNKANKTGIELLSPLMTPAIEIYERMGQFPLYTTAHLVNYQIRALLREMKITNKITLTHKVYGRGEIKETKLLSEVASSHVCRGSFISNLLNHRVDRFKVQAMTHKAMNDGTAFSIYDKRSEIDRAIEFYEATRDLNSNFFTYK